MTHILNKNGLTYVIIFTHLNVLCYLVESRPGHDVCHCHYVRTRQNRLKATIAHARACAICV